MKRPVFFLSLFLFFLPVIVTSVLQHRTHTSTRAHTHSDWCSISRRPHSSSNGKSHNSICKISHILSPLSSIHPHFYFISLPIFSEDWTCRVMIGRCRGAFLIRRGQRDSRQTDTGSFKKQITGRSVLISASLTSKNLKIKQFELWGYREGGYSPLMVCDPHNKQLVMHS